MVRLSYSCSVGSGVTAATDINGVTVVDGEQPHLVTLDPDDPDANPRWKRTKKGKVTIWNLAFLYTVTCEDRAGNAAVVEIVPIFRPPGVARLDSTSRRIVPRMPRAPRPLDLGALRSGGGI